MRGSFKISRYSNNKVHTIMRTTISMFYGIIISMYNRNEHNPPHFHASYQGYVATFDIDGELKEGDMPKAQRKLIEA